MDKLNCVLLDDYQQVGLASADFSPILDRVQVTSQSQHHHSVAELVEAIKDAQIVVTLRERVTFSAEVFGQLPKLKLLVASGMRNAAIDLVSATDHGVCVSGTASSQTPPTELTWALILGLARHLVTEDNNLRSGGWQTTVGADLHGRTLGLIGLGKIGLAVAKIGLAFGMDVVAWSENLTGERATEVGVRRAETLADLLSTSDFVSIHTKLSSRTRNLLGAEQLAQLKPTSFLINTSRADIVDTRALLAALQHGKLAGAGLDVFDTEPLPADSPWRSATRTLLTPHLGYVTTGNLHTYYSEAVEDIAAFLDGQPIRVLARPDA